MPLETAQNEHPAADDELKRRILALLGEEMEKLNPLPMQVLIGHLLVELSPEELVDVIRDWLRTMTL